MLYWNILDEKRIKLLKKLVNTLDLKNFYLGGGTGLSLQLGLRESVDFDFFTPNKFNNNIILDKLKSFNNAEITQNIEGTCDVLIDNIQTSFFYYPNKILDNFIISEELPNLQLASVLDIAVMKVAAISGRGAKKDFFDLYHILKSDRVTNEELIQGLFQKFGNKVNYRNILMSLTYFEDAENEKLPKCFVDNDWEKIKIFFNDISYYFEENFIKILRNQNIKLNSSGEEM